MPLIKTETKFTDGFLAVVRYFKLYQKEGLWLAFLGIISAILNGLVPFIVGRFFDSIVTPGTFAIFNFVLSLSVSYLVIWLIIQIAASLIDWKRNIGSINLGINVYSDYIAGGHSFLLQLPQSFHSKHKVGKIADKINRAANSLETMVNKTMVEIAPPILSIFIALGLSFYIRPSLTLILLLGVGIYLYLSLKKIGPLAKLQIQMNKAYGDAYGDSYDAIFNVAEVKQATTELHEKKKIFYKFKERAGKLYVKMTSIWEDLDLLQRVIVVGVQLIIFLLSLYFIVNKEMTIGELITINAYAGMVFGPFGVISRNWQFFQNGLIAVGQMEKVFNLPIEKYIPDNPAPITSIRGEITFDNVSFSYEKGKPVLNNISFSVKPGETIALVGESGVGKSTLIQLLSGYYFPKKGNIKIDGYDVKRINLKTLRSHVGVVSQELVLFNDTIKNNIKYGNFKASEADIKRAAEEAHATEFIEKFPKKWNQVVGERGIKLSVGQKQRVAIARAVLRNPTILILDEPTSALDAKTESIIQESLNKLMSGRTTFIIAHRLSTVRHANKILVFKDGSIVETGTHNELVKKEKGIYNELYSYQIGLHS